MSYVLEGLLPSNRRYMGLYGPVSLTVATLIKRAIRLYEKFGFVKEIEFTTNFADFQTMRRV